jgi:hypothetical protein
MGTKQGRSEMEEALRKSATVVIFTLAVFLTGCGQGQQGPKGEQGPPGPQGSKGDQGLIVQDRFSATSASSSYYCRVLTSTVVSLQHIHRWLGKRDGFFNI